MSLSVVNFFILLHFLKCGQDQRGEVPPSVIYSWKEAWYSSTGEWQANKDNLMRYWLFFQGPSHCFLFSAVSPPFTSHYLSIPLSIFSWAENVEETFYPLLCLTKWLGREFCSTFAIKEFWDFLSSGHLYATTLSRKLSLSTP